MENENLIPEEEESSILTLTDENGVDNDFEYLDCIEYKGKEYLVLMPVDTVETEIVILEVEPVDEENENYLAVEDEKLLNAVYEIFKEKYKDVMTFEDLFTKSAAICGAFSYFAGNSQKIYSDRPESSLRMGRKCDMMGKIK